MRYLFSLPIVVVMACSAVSAQQITEFRQPGDVLRVEVKCDGPDAAKIKSVSLYLGMVGEAPKDQAGFDASFSGDRVNAVSPNTFIAEARIPNNIASGDYLLFVNAQAETGSTQYAAGRQFQMPPFHIRNPRTFVPPQITVTEKRNPR
jgi:hypothetical protein